jgi:hypothetical protein
MKRAQDFARFRAAEITVKTGYRYFRILDTTINHNAGALTRGNWASFPSAIYTIQCHNEFQADSIDATQLMNILANSYQS